MVETKSPSEAVANWKEAIARVPAKYRAGIERVKDFTGKAIAGQDVYVTKMTDPAVLARREKGLREAGDAKWKKGALEKGAARIGPGMSAAESEFAKGISEVISVLQGLTLPPRTADPIANVKRVEEIVRAMVEHFKK